MSAGRTRKDGDAKLTILAVDDDDQNICSFRKTSVDFIRRFEAGYKAGKSYLMENFRPTWHIIGAANTIIQGTASCSSSASCRTQTSRPSSRCPSCGGCARSTLRPTGSTSRCSPVLTPA